MLTSLYSPACPLIHFRGCRERRLWSEDLSPTRSRAPLYLSLDNECIVLVSKGISQNKYHCQCPCQPYRMPFMSPSSSVFRSPINESRFHFLCPGAVSSTEIEPPTTEATGEEAREAENGTDPETRETLPGFGSAHMFMPIPNSGTVVAAHCNWQFRYNYVENRIPRK